MTARDMRRAAGLVARVLSTPLPHILSMRVSEFERWHQAALDVLEDLHPEAKGA